MYLYSLLKCVLYNLNIIETEESYTSQASFLDLNEIPTYKKRNNKNYQFSGKRTFRGLYKSKNEILINADVKSIYENLSIFIHTLPFIHFVYS